MTRLDIYKALAAVLYDPPKLASPYQLAADLAHSLLLLLPKEDPKEEPQNLTAEEFAELYRG